MIQDKLLEDFKQSMKNKDNIRKSIIQMVRSKIADIEKAEKVENLSEERVFKIMQNFIKQNNDTLKYLDSSTTENQVKISKLMTENIILEEYLPKQLSRDALIVAITTLKEKLDITSVKDMGKLIKATRDHFGASADGKLVSEIVKEILN